MTKVDANAKADCGGKPSSHERPLKPEWAAQFIEAFAAFTAVAEFLVSLVRDHPCQPSDVFETVLMQINYARERCNRAYTESLLSSLPPLEALKEIERLRGYEARMLAKERKALKAASKSAKRSQGTGKSPVVKASEKGAPRKGGVDLAKRSQMSTTFNARQAALCHRLAKRSQLDFVERHRISGVDEHES